MGEQTPFVMIAKLKELIRRELKRRGHLPREVSVSVKSNNIVEIGVLLLNGRQAAVNEKLQQIQAYYEQSRLNAAVGPLVTRLSAELRTSVERQF